MLIPQPSALTTLGYMLTAISFMFGIQLLRSPATARQGNRVAAVGMLLVLGITAALIHNTNNWPLIIPDPRRHGYRGGVGAPGAHDRDAADGRALQRHGRWLGGPDRDSGFQDRGGERDRASGCDLGHHGQLLLRTHR